MSSNSYEEAARARKVEAIVEQLDATLTRLGFDPHKAAADVIPVLHSTGILKDCAETLGKKAPSPETRALVIGVYERRANAAVSGDLHHESGQGEAVSRAGSGVRDVDPVLGAPASAPESAQGSPAPGASSRREVLARITASKLDLAVNCLHWAELGIAEERNEFRDARANRGTAFHDLASTGEIQPETLAKIPPETEAEVRKMYAVWLKNGKKLLPVDPRKEVAFVLEPDGFVRELGQNLGRNYQGAVGLCGTVDVYGDDMTRDYKTGRKYHDADEAWQLRFASVVTGCHTSAFDYIAASGRTTPDEYTRSDQQIAADKQRLVVLMSDVIAGRTAPIAGSHCVDGYCPAQKHCPAFAAAHSAPAKDSQKTEQENRIMGKMTLANVKKGRLETPICIVLYGPEGIGKSTFAANAPSPVFLGAEDGTAHLDVARFPVPSNWAEAQDALSELAVAPHEYKTLVVDTADWIEPLIHDAVCADGGKKSIEDFGYGKGYVGAMDRWREFLGQLDVLRAARGINVIILAHSQVKAFRNPAGDDYDRYELKLHGKAAGLLKEWANAVLFTNYVTHPKKDENAKTKMFGEGARVVYTEHRPAWDAKNRYGLPFKMPLDWAEFERAARTGEPATFEDLSAEIAKLIESADDALKAQAAPAVERCGKDTRKLSQLADWLRSKLGKEAA